MSFSKPYSRHLLVIACSQRKFSDPGLLPAISRYDGPSFRVLRRFLNQKPSDSPEISIYVLSAKFGLIHNEYLIPCYDQRMTKTRSVELRPRVIAELENIFDAGAYEELFICVGRDYLQALDGYSAIIPTGLSVRTSTGGLGKKLAELHNWLYGKLPDLSHSLPVTARQGKARFKGIDVVLTPAQVLDVARQAMVEGKGNPASYQSWYVLVDGQQVAPKWLVSQLFGLPVSAFVTEDARRVLAQLGIEVRRV